MKIRKIHRHKRYRYNVNRKNKSKAHKSTGKIKDPILKKLWQDRKKPIKNFTEMGLAADPNKALGIPNYKQERLQLTKFMNDCKEQSSSGKRPPKRIHVVEQLENMAKEKADSKFRLPKGAVKHLSYFLNKYKFDYKAMVTDRRNHDQWTWRQFRIKIKQFMNIPEQFNEYLRKNNLPLKEKLSWPEYSSDSEWN